MEAIGVAETYHLVSEDMAADYEQLQAAKRCLELSWFALVRPEYVLAGQLEISVLPSLPTMTPAGLAYGAMRCRGPVALATGQERNS